MEIMVLVAVIVVVAGALVVSGFGRRTGSRRRAFRRLRRPGASVSSGSPAVPRPERRLGQRRRLHQPVDVDRRVVERRAG